MKRTNKRQIAKGLQEIGAAWAVRSDKYICTDYNCCQPLDGDKPAYHIHPHSDDPRQDSVKRFRNLDEIAGYIEARKAAGAAPTIGQAMLIMEDFWADIN